jgi:hypothetical protein
MLDQRDAADAANATVALDELRRSEVPAFTLPQPTSGAMRRVAALVASQAPAVATINELARAVA